MQRPQRRFQFTLVVATSIATAACAGRAASNALTQDDANGAVAAFLDAVRAKDLRGMANRWGTSSGPATKTMPATEVERRLVVISSFLKHDAFEILNEQTLVEEQARQRTVRVRLSRSGCQAVVPFHVVRSSAGWMIENIDLAAAGSPTEVCRAQNRRLD